MRALRPSALAALFVLFGILNGAVAQTSSALFEADPTVTIRK
jgi:hypothetical protein